MKKSIILGALLAVLGFTFTSCKTDTQPRLERPTEFKLNTPAMADQLYVMSSESALEFTVSQPNYGLATTPNYQIEIAKTADGFDNGEYQVVEGTTTIAKIDITGEAFCIAMCSLWGYDEPDTFDATPRPVYVRAHAWVDNAEYSSIYSNVICLQKVQPYFAVKVPGHIWVVGDCEGWSCAPNPDWMLTETEPESKIFKGTFFIPDGKFQFRFYAAFDADEPWEWNSVGAQDADNPVNIEFSDGVYSGACFYDPNTKAAGKGSWQVPDWVGATVSMTVNLGTKTVHFQIVD